MMKNLRSNPIELDYTIIERVTTGLKLTGVQTKSIANNQVDIRGARGALLSTGFAVLGMQFSGSTESVPALLHKKEINRLAGMMTKQGLTVMVESLIMLRGKFKVILVVCKGKTKYDKRAEIKKHDTDLRLRRVIKSQQIDE